MSPRQFAAFARDRVRHAMTSDAGRSSGNFVPGTGLPRISVASLREGGVDIALSVLHSPFDELAPSLRNPRRWLALRGLLRTVRADNNAPNARAAGSLALGGLAADRPPRRGAFARLLRQIDSAERFVEHHHGREAAFAHFPSELDAVRASGRVALVHAVEGGFHLPPDPQDVGAAVRELAQRGVAYITLAHLLYRSVATVAPAIPYLSDDTFRRLYPQPASGLTAHARAAIASMVAEGILVDVCHMSEASLRDTFELLDRLDPGREVPVLASHVGLRFGDQQYNLDASTVERIVARRGVIGLIVATHQLADGLPAPVSFDDSMELLFRHVDEIAEIAGSHEHTAIGTDLGGFIEPLPGLADARAFPAVRGALERRYGARVAELIAAGNAERVLRAHWRRIPAG